jgi:hypothetical protein
MLAVITAGAMIAAITLSSCATFSDNANAARVGDVELSRDDLQHYVQDALQARDAANAPDELDGDAFRQVIASWVVDELIRQKLAADGDGVTDADRQLAESQLTESLAGVEVSDFLREFELASLATRAAFDRAQSNGALIDFAREQTVYIDPFYGYWDIETGLVQPLGS